MPQLVGASCAICGERITNELDARFCRGCGSPRHDACARPSHQGSETSCHQCGATVDPADRTPEPKVPPRPAPAAAPQGPFPVAKVCPKCASANCKLVRPVGWVAFKWDRVCKECGTRYSPPTPVWAGLVFLGAGLLLAGFGGLSVLLALLRGNVLSLPAVACEGFLGVIGCLAIVHGLRSLFNPGDV